MSDIDDKLAAAWRAASREEPPKALDAALRAAARRAVHSRPAGTRHTRSWPLAAAAVVAVLAVGILQLTPPEEVTPSIVADSTMRQLPAVKKSEVASTAMPAEAPPAPASPAAIATPPSGAASAPAEASRRAGPSASTSGFATASKQVAQAPPAQPVPALDRFNEKNSAAAETDQVTAKLHARADTKPDMESKVAETRDAREAAAAPPTSRAEPFPAVTGGKSLAAADAAVGERAQVGAMSDAPASPAAAPAAVAASEPAKPQVASANAMRAEESQARAPAPMALAKTAAAPERAKDKDAAIKPPEEWIKLIRRLKSEGRNDEATKELAAFRAAYKERADSLLPADLREARH